MDTVRRTRKSPRPAPGRGGWGQSEPQLRIVRSEGAEDAAHDVDERLSAAVADLRWKLHDVEALEWRRNLIARGAAPLIAMPHGYEHIAQVLNSKQRLDERIADVICGVAKPLLGVVGAAGVAALLAATPLLNARLVQGFELPRGPQAVVPLLATVPEQEARLVVPPLAAGGPVVAAGAQRAAPAATTFARPVNPFSAGERDGFWSSHVLGTPGSGAEPQEAAGPATPPAQPAPSGATGTAQTPDPRTAASPPARTTPAPAPSTPGTAQPAPGTHPSPGATPPSGTPAPGAGTPTSSGDATSSPSPTSPSPTPTSGTPQNGAASTSGTPTTSTTPTPGTSGSGTTPAPTTSGAAPTP